MTDPMADARGRLRASDADRERTVEELKVKFVQGRLTRDELDLRVGLAFVSRTYADLAAVLADIPARPVPAAAPRPARSPVRTLAGQAGQPPADSKARGWRFGLATMVLPAVIAAVLLTSNQGIFGVVVAALTVYVLGLLMAAAWLPRPPKPHLPARAEGGYRRGQRIS